jgi:phosphoglycerate dehydrogenase-like enzyme
LSLPRVFIFRPVDESGASHRQIEAAGCKVMVNRDGATADQVLAEIGQSQVLLGATFRGGTIDRRLLEASPSLRLVSKYTIGVDDIDLVAATELGILVTHCPTEANWGGVAEGTMAFMLAMLKRIRERDRAVKRGAWRSDDLQGYYLGRREDGYAGLTVGIVGLGRIGRRLAELLAPWRLRLLACDPYVDEAQFARRNVERLDLDALLAASDVVTLHCSLTEETRGLIGARALALMKTSALLINTARGPIVDVDALCDALAADRLGGAALDVLPLEPPPPGSRILELGDRVLLSPHMVAANQGGTLQTAIPWATEAALAALRGEVPARVYNSEAIPLWRERFAGRSLL